MYLKLYNLNPYGFWGAAICFRDPLLSHTGPIDHCLQSKCWYHLTVFKELDHLLVIRSQCCLLLSIGWMQVKSWILSVWLPWVIHRFHVAWGLRHCWAWVFCKHRYAIIERQTLLVGKIISLLTMMEQVNLTPLCNHITNITMWIHQS